MVRVFRRAVTVLAGAVLLAVGFPLATQRAPNAQAAPTPTLKGPKSSLGFSGTVGANSGHECTGLGDAACRTHAFRVSKAPITLSAVLSADGDFDLLLYSGGQEAAAAETPASTENLDGVLHPGTYILLVQPYETGEGAPYSIQLTAKAVSPRGTMTVKTSWQQQTFEGPAPTSAPTPTGALDPCHGNADRRCHLYRVRVPFVHGRIVTHDRSTSAAPLDEYAVRVYDGYHRLLAEDAFIDGDDRVTATLLRPGDYYVQVEAITATAGDTYALDLTVTEAPGGGTPVAPDPGPQPPETGIFTKTEGFATKTGYRGVVAWQASEPVVATVRWGTAPDALTSSADVALQDTAGMLVIEGLQAGRVYHWQVTDRLTGASSALSSFTALNAYEDWNGITYTIDLLVQLDTQSLPSEVDADQSIQDIAQGMSVFAERVYDATDGFVRIGNVLVTDTTVDYAVNVPNPPLVHTGFIACTPTNYADVLVQTTVPFDSHTYGGYSIEEPCIQFYVGRIGQLVVPWADDLHFAHVAAHELAHYAFAAPDLYSESSVFIDESGCRNLAWDGSLMHNSGGWNAELGRWEMTELDRNPTLTPCDHSGESYSWDTLRARYLNVPLRVDGPVEHIVDERARGNEDGGALRLFVLDREVRASTLTEVAPDDSDEPDPAVCLPGGPQIHDPAGDATEIVVTGPTPAPSEANLDVTTAQVSAAGTDLVFRIDVADLDAPPTTAGGQFFRFYFSYEGSRRNVVARRSSPGAEPAFTLSAPSSAPPATPGTPITGSFDDAANRVTIVLPMDLVRETDPEVDPITSGTVLSDLEVLGQRDPGALVVLVADTATGTCTYAVP